MHGGKLSNLIINSSSDNFKQVKMDIKYSSWGEPWWGKAYICDEERVLELLNLLVDVLISCSWLMILLRDLWILLVRIWELCERFVGWEMGAEMECWDLDDTDGWDMEETAGGGVLGVEMCCLDELPLSMWEVPLFELVGDTILPKPIYVYIHI